VLGGDLDIRTNAESPGADQIPESQGDRVMHARLVVGDQVLMASDAPPGQYQRPAGNYVSITVDDAGEARRLFDALADGAQVPMPFDATFWSPGFGMLVDRWGTPWMVNTMPPAD
jgi:PhnB protein